MTRHCVLSTVAAEHWDKPIFLDEYTKNERFFWRDNLSYRKTRHCFLHSTPHKFVYSDASDTGCGSLLTLDTKQICHKLWDENERSKSSTWRELTAIDFALPSFTSLLQGSHTKWYTDNQAAAKIVEVSSMKPDLHRIAISIFRQCLTHCIKLDIHRDYCMVGECGRFLCTSSERLLHERARAANE